MKHNTYFFLVTSVILAGGSVYLALNQIDGWGWFLFGALITFEVPSKSEDKEDE
jgi:hypothetical protein